MRRVEPADRICCCCADQQPESQLGLVQPRQELCYGMLRQVAALSREELRF